MTPSSVLLTMASLENSTIDARCALARSVRSHPSISSVRARDPLLGVKCLAHSMPQDAPAKLRRRHGLFKTMNSPSIRQVVNSLTQTPKPFHNPISCGCRYSAQLLVPMTVSGDCDWRNEKCLSLAYRGWSFLRLPPSLSSKSLADGQQPNQPQFRLPERQLPSGTPSAPTVGRLSKMAGSFAARAVHGEASELSHARYCGQGDVLSITKWHPTTI